MPSIAHHLRAVLAPAERRVVEADRQAVRPAHPDAHDGRWARSRQRRRRPRERSPRQQWGDASAAGELLACQLPSQLRGEISLRSRDAVGHSGPCARAGGRSDSRAGRVRHRPGPCRRQGTGTPSSSCSEPPLDRSGVANRSGDTVVDSPARPTTLHCSGCSTDHPSERSRCGQPRRWTHVAPALLARASTGASTPARSRCGGPSGRSSRDRPSLVPHGVCARAPGDV